MTHPKIEDLRRRLEDGGLSFDQEVDHREHLEQLDKEIERRSALSERQRAYEDFLASPEWKKLRNQRLRMDGYLCAGCGGAATQAHHVWYPREEHWHETPLWCLISLCESCHRKAHQIFDRGVPWGSK